jgi:hypothetical protein
VEKVYIQFSKTVRLENSNGIVEDYCMTTMNRRLTSRKRHAKRKLVIVYKHHAIKTTWGVEVKLLVFQTSA